jgi:hypothetical protein
MAMLIFLRMRQSSKLRKERIAMNAQKVERGRAQIKLVFDRGEGPEFPLECLMEELGLEVRAFASSAGLCTVSAIIGISG